MHDWIKKIENFLDFAENSSLSYPLNFQYDTCYYLQIYYAHI